MILILGAGMIIFNRVTYAYERENPVYEGLDLELDSGLILLMGPNGCGKSTLLKLASGVEKPESGRITVNGHDLWKDEVKARASLTYLPEYPDLTPYATVGEIITLVCRMRKRPLSAAREALDFFGLWDLASHTVRELSLGQRRRASFAAAMIGNPSHILLDEPLSGMDRSIQSKIQDWIFSKAEQDCLVLIVSHQLEPFVRAVSQLVSLKNGQAFVCSDLPDDIQKRTERIEGVARGF